MLESLKYALYVTVFVGWSGVWLVVYRATGLHRPPQLGQGAARPPVPSGRRTREGVSTLCP